MSGFGVSVYGTKICVCAQVDAFQLVLCGDEQVPLSAPRASFFFWGGRNWDSDKIGQKLGFVWENREDAKDQQQKADLIRRIGW